MKEATLTIWSEGQSQQLPLSGTRVTIGRGEQADLCLSDAGLSRIHASINRDSQRIWVLDEGSTNGTFVNGQRVTASGVPLKDGDQISLGDTTKIKLSLARQQASVETKRGTTQAADTTQPASGLSIVPLTIAAAVVIVILTTFAVGAWYIRKNKTGTDVATKFTPTPTLPPTATPAIDNSSSANTEKVAIEETADSAISGLTITNVKASEVSTTSTSSKLYKQMSEEEKVYFVNKKAQDIALMVGNRPQVFPDEAITIIKFWLDAYVRRIGTGNNKLWAEDLHFMFKRARTTFTPTIIRAFKANGAPPVVGVYLPVIETEYRNITTENFAGAAGLFQFIGPTARGYGVDPAERTNIEKMAPAAARYINDRLAEFGADAVGVGLSIAGYNRSPDSVRRDLHDVIDSQNKDRDFWILVKNKSKLDAWFQKENINYVPRFFAAAIIGENPWAFGLKMRQLSTYTEPDTSSDE